MKTCVILAPNDRYNYGDLLFSHVLRNKIGKYYDEIIDIATIDADLTSYGGHKVHSIKTISKLTQNKHFDLILAGGHSLFCPWVFVLYCLDNKYAWLSRLNFFLSRFMGNAKSKSVTNFLSRLYFGVDTRYPYSIGKYEIKNIRKIIYNSVDGNLENHLCAEDLRLLMSVDYLSVRNHKTCGQLKSNGLKVHLYPDSAINISQIFPKEKLLANTSISYDYFNTSYIVFQINRGLGESCFSEIVTNLRDIINKYNYKVYLCPIGFAKGHEDLTALNRIYEYIDNKNVVLFNSLNIWDIMGLIAHSRGFIGSSLHGCITAMSYCRPYIGLEVDKTTSYINDWGLGTDYCSDCRNFYSKFHNILNCTSEMLKMNLDLQLSKSNESFKIIRNIINN